MNRRFGLTAALLATVSAHGYIRSTAAFSDGTVAQIYRTDNQGIQFYVNNKVVAGAQSSAGGAQVTVISPGSNPLAAIRSAMATWNAVSTAKISFLTLKTTDKVNDRTDNQMTIVIGSTADDVSAINGALAVTAVQTAPFTAGATSGVGAIADTDILLNPAISFSTDGSTSNDLQAVITHELGHSLGLNHSGVLGATMFQYASLNQRYLSTDEIGFATSVYPASASSLGTISGKVVASDGSPIQSGLVTLMDTSAGTALTALTGADGTYSIQASPGSYIVYVEPLAAGNIVQAGNLYLTTATKVTSNFQVTMLGGFDSPTSMSVTSGNTTNVPNLTVTSGTSAITFPYIGNATGGSFNVGTTATLVGSGQTIDLFLIGGGVDGTVSARVFGKGITMKSLAVDPNIKFTGSLTGLPFVRVSVNVAAQTTPTLATLILTKGSSVFAITGAFVLVPPTPKFTSAGIVSAASYAGGGTVSPGGLSSIYDTTNNSIGPAAPMSNTSYDQYGNLPTTAGGVTVTFDGVPAPIYFAYSGQINIQVPFEVAGKTSTKVVVNYYGSQSAPVTVQVAPSQPAFFTFTPQGKDVIIQNFADNYALNSASKPAGRGTIVLIYGTGIGKPSYDLQTGQPGVAPPAGYTGSYSCSFGGQSVNASIAYWNYGFVGEALWVATVPANAPTGPVALTCTDTVSGATTQAGTIYLK